MLKKGDGRGNAMSIRTQAIQCECIRIEGGDRIDPLNVMFRDIDRKQGGRGAAGGGMGAGAGLGGPVGRG